MVDAPGGAEGGLLVVTRFLPGWLSYLVLSLIFFAAWIDPSWVGWEGAAALKYLAFLEIIAASTLAYLLIARDEFLGWLHIVPSVALLALLLWLFVSPLVAIVLPLHLLIRTGSLWRNRQSTHEVYTALVFSLAVMAVVWLLVGLVPHPHLGWTPAETPSALWWTVLTWGGWKQVPDALPVWGAVYFLSVSVIQFLDVRWPGMVTVVEWLDSRADKRRVV